MTGFSSPGLSTNSSQLLVGTPVVSGAGTGYIGAAITVSSAAIGNLPITYQWQSGGASGSLTNVPNATNSTLLATPPNTGTYRYDYIATDSSGSITSGVATATIIVGTPMISPSNTVYLGSPITLTSPSGILGHPTGITSLVVHLPLGWPTVAAQKVREFAFELVNEIERFYKLCSVSGV
jgi:hypothetical protein